MLGKVPSLKARFHFVLVVPSKALDADLVGQKTTGTGSACRLGDAGGAGRPEVVRWVVGDGLRTCLRKRGA